MSLPSPVALSDDDISQAMKEIPGYLDITPADFREVYALAFRQAVARMIHSIPARDIMTRDVVSCRTDTPLFEVAELMAHHGIGGLPAVDSEANVRGVISEKDFFAHMDSAAGAFMGVVAQCLRQQSCLAVPIRGKVVDEIMSRPAVTVREDTPLARILELMKQRKLNRVPVLDGKGQLAGIITRDDILSSFQAAATILGDT